MKIETSWDDNCSENYRLVLLLEKYRLPATFYLPIDGIDWDLTKLILSKGFSVGSHTITHPSDMKLLTHDELFYEIQTSKDLLENATGTFVESICWPRGRYDSRCIEVAKKAGYFYSRSTVVGQVDTPSAFVRNTSVHVYNRNEYKGLDWHSYAIDMLKQNPEVFHLWGHGWEIDKNNDWELLEDLFKKI